MSNDDLSFDSLSDFHISRKQSIESNTIDNKNSPIENDKSLSLSFESELSQIENDEDINLDLGMGRRSYSRNGTGNKKNNSNENSPNGPKTELSPKVKKKLTKEDLNKTPIPIFECIYCSNEDVASKHLSMVIIEDKYDYNCSPFDIKLIDEYLNSNGPNGTTQEISNSKENIIKLIMLKSTEFLKKSFSTEESLSFLKSDNFREQCKKENFIITLRLINKIEVAIEKKKTENSSNTNNNPKNIKNYLNALKIPLNSTNSILNNINAISSFCNTNNNSSINFNSISFGGNNNNTNNNIDNDNSKIEANKNIQMKSIELDSIEENRDNNSESEESQEDFFNFLKFDLKRKIKREDIEWEEEAFDIWNPKYDSEEEENIKEDKFEEEKEIKGRSLNLKQKMEIGGLSNSDEFSFKEKIKEDSWNTSITPNTNFYSNKENSGKSGQGERNSNKNTYNISSSSDTGSQIKI